MEQYKRNVGLFGRFLVYITILFRRHSSFGVGRENLFSIMNLGRKFVELFLKIGRAACYNG